MGSVVKTSKVQVWGVWVQSLVGELRSHILHDGVKKPKNKIHGSSNPLVSQSIRLIDNHLQVSLQPTLETAGLRTQE